MVFGALLQIVGTAKKKNHPTKGSALLIRERANLMVMRGYESCFHFSQSVNSVS